MSLASQKLFTPKRKFPNRITNKPSGLFAKWLFFIFLLSWSYTASPHPLAPSLLQIQELPHAEPTTTASEKETTSPVQRVSVLWKTNRKGSPKHLLPALPNQCEYEQTPVSRFEDNAIISKAVLACSVPSLVGATFGVSKLNETPTNVLLRYVRLDGVELNQLLSSQNPVFVVPEEKSTSTVSIDYLQLGFDHLLSGWDHLLFVLALMLIMRELRRLIFAITSFTVGHSITLALATFGVVQLPSALVEFAIALSIVVLAIELLNQKPDRSFLEKHFWLVPIIFGLLHGLGFAGALADTGLPQNNLVAALFAFNVGIELGQLLVVLIALVVIQLGKSLYPLIVNQKEKELPTLLSKSLTAYFIGSVSAYWVIERAF